MQYIAGQNETLNNEGDHQAFIHAYRMSKIQNSIRQYTTAHETTAQNRAKRKNGGNEHGKERRNHQFKGN